MGWLPYAFRTSGKASTPVLDHWEGLPTRPGPPGESPDPSLTSGRASLAVPDLREGFLTHPEPP